MRDLTLCRLWRAIEWLCLEHEIESVAALDLDTLRIGYAPTVLPWVALEDAVPPDLLMGDA